MYKGKGKRSAMKRLVARVNKITRTIETKSSVQPFLDGTELGHNATVLYSSTMLATNNGTMDVEDGIGQRIGDKITLSSVQIKGMLELNERYSDVTVKVIVVKSAKGDVPTQANMYQGASGNKLLDNYNTERFTILANKVVKLTAQNGGQNPSGAQTAGSGFQQGTPLVSRATKMFNISLSGSSFGKGGVLQYENGSQQPKFYDYHLLFFAYSNYSTSSLIGFNVARVNDAFVKLHYKDA